MAEPYTGEIRMFAGNFAPRGWAYCDGQLLPTSQNDALFSLLGTIYGGDGRTTFGLPDLRGRVPIHMGQGAGMQNRRIGQKLGAEAVTVTVNQLPTHNHGPLQANSQAASDLQAAGRVHALSSVDIYAAENASVNMHPNAVSTFGGSRSHPNMMPYLCIHFIIALFGVYPSRT